MIQVPLKILITDASLLASDVVKEQVDKLEKAGHSVVIDEGLKSFDFICGPNCWLLRPEVANLFILAVTNARKIANANQERINQVKLAKASKKPTKRAVKPRKRSTVTETETSSSGERGGQEQREQLTLDTILGDNP